MERYEIRAARTEELSRLQSIEDDAGRLFGEIGIDPDLPGLSLTALRAGLDAGLLWVVASERGLPVGFALCWEREGALHLRELDVHPDHGRRGLGARLLAHVTAQARARGLRAVTLTTFSEVPWNAAYYERHGFYRLADDALPPWLADIRREEARSGLDRWPRIAMMKSVPPMDAGAGAANPAL